MTSFSRKRSDTLVETPATKFPAVEGLLFKRGYFNDWQKRHVELRDNMISVSVVRGGMGYQTFRVGPGTRCEESSLRHFCFVLSNPDGESLTLAAENIAAKETWIEAIQSALSLLRLARRKHRSFGLDALAAATEEEEDYHSRAQIFIKVIQARNLMAKDSNGFSDPYVQISLGSSTVRTTTRKKNLNPDWGE